MTGHTAVDDLVAKHGNTTEGRAKARAHIRRQILAAAEQEAALAGRSPNCVAAIQAQRRHYCANNGTTCICECHDPGATP